jgi:hypothetical protein
MWFAVARLTRRNVFMFFLMTIGAGKVVVLRRICLKQRNRFLMTAPAIIRRDIIGVSYDKWHVHRVAGLAGFKIHVCGVFFVALHAAGDLTVSCMAFVAGQISVSTRLGFYLFALLRMA